MIFIEIRIIIFIIEILMYIKYYHFIVLKILIKFLLLNIYCYYHQNYILLLLKLLS